MIDLHSHILPGLDDGSRTLEDARELARRAAADGVTAETVYGLGLRGFVPVLAHPERNREVQADPGRLAEAARLGALVQLTAASVDGRIGRSSQRAAERLLANGLAHVLASDAHNPDIREAGLSAAAEAVGDDRLAAYLTADAPAAIVAGEAVAPPPKAARRRRRFLLF